MRCASCVTPWLWSDSPPQSWAPPPRHPRICSGVSCFHDLSHAPFSTWHAPLLLPACQKPSHPWCRAPGLLEAVLDHSPGSHVSGLWMALVFLCTAVWQLITHWLVAFIVQHWAVICLLYILSFSSHLCLISSSSLRAQSIIFGILFYPPQCLACLS